MRFSLAILSILLAPGLLTLPTAQASTCVSLLEGAAYVCDDYTAYPTRVGSAPAGTEVALYRCGVVGWAGTSGIGAGCAGGAVAGRVAGIGLPVVPVNCYGGFFDGAAVAQATVFVFGLCPAGAGVLVSAGTAARVACVYYYAVLANGQVVCAGA